MGLELDSVDAFLHRLHMNAPWPLDTLHVHGVDNASSSRADNSGSTGNVEPPSPARNEDTGASAQWESPNPGPHPHHRHHQPWPWPRLRHRACAMAAAQLLGRFLLPLRALLGEQTVAGHNVQVERVAALAARPPAPLRPAGGGAAVRLRTNGAPVWAEKPRAGSFAVPTCDGSNPNPNPN